MNTIDINGLKIELIRKNIKTVRLSVHPPDGHVRLVAPTRVKEEVIIAFVTSKLPWIKKQQEKLKNNIRVSEKEYITGETHYFLGSPYILQIIESTARSKVEISNNEYINVYIGPNSTKEQREKVMIEWYRKQLKVLIPELISKWEPIMEVKVKEWGVKQMKTRWGTCNIKAQRIWLNLELAKAHPRCLEYIVVHEMVHLLEKYHNQRFNAFMCKFLPDWEERKKELSKIMFAGSGK